ncbi:type I restriction enzyme endonuclease domain-containing protein, partial [Turicimonas muris]|uniref:type I restriction enzyme endonuclease domain-containing protein n=1 Tax=Turicimonas muris TaxID=1796652 RepID=UPI0026DFBAFD
NIICISDEAHRTQTGIGAKLKKTDNGVFTTYGFAKYLRDSFPNACYCGFTGTPIDDTISVFGDVVDSYTMKESSDDGITVRIAYEPRLARVIVSDEQVREIQKYYDQCAAEGSTEEQIEASQRAMSSMAAILGHPDRIKKLARDIVTHYESLCAEKPEVVQKAMIVCTDRKVAFHVLNEIKAIRPEWGIPKKAENETILTKEQKDKLLALPQINLVATRRKSDRKELYQACGTKEYRKKLDEQFKNNDSNFKIAVVVDMWITGFDVPCLAVLYNDKPLKRHTLIQAISRVNRKYPGKEFGLVVDYLGIRNNMKKALKIFDDGKEMVDPVRLDPIEEAKEAYKVFANTLMTLKELFHEFDASNFFKEQGIKRFECLQEAEDFVLQQPPTGEKDSDGNEISFVKLFSSLVKRLRASYSICKNSEELSEQEIDWAHFFMTVLSLIAKTTATGISVEKMNKTVESMVHAALQCNGVESVLNAKKAEEIFSEGFLKELEEQVKPNTRFQLLVKMLQKEIREYGKTNGLKAREFSERLKEIVERYNNRDHLTFAGEVATDVINDVIALATKVQEDRVSFQKLGITFEEKAFYDILQSQREKHKFEYSEEKMIKLAREIKTLIEYVPTANWLDNNNLRNQVQFDLTALLYENGYPPDWNREVFEKVIEQVENYKKYQ